MTRLATLARLWVFAALFAGGARAQVPDGVTVEAVRFEGSADIGKELLTSAVDVPVERLLTREELDVLLERARHRLMALGYFKTVDLQLLKGKQRGHFTLLVTLEAERSTYAGVSLKQQRYKEEGTYDDRDEVTGTQQVFTGSRNLFGKGLRGEVSLWRREGWTRSWDSDPDDNVGTSGGNTGDRYGSAQLSLFDPSLLGTPWFAGTMLGYIRLESRSDSAQYISRVEANYKTALFVVGRRFGLVSASASVFRIGGELSYESQSGNYSGEGGDGYYSTVATLGLRYSDKSFLTTIEPGTVVAVTHERVTAETVEPGTVLARALHTWVFADAGDKALTPAVAGEWLYEDHCRNDDCSKVIKRSFDLGLTYEHVLVNRVVLGVGYGEFFLLKSDRSDYDAGFPHRRWRVAATYDANGLILEAAFLYGDVGLDRSQWELIFPDHGRFTQ